MTTAHSPYGFSVIGRIVACPGSRALCEQYPPSKDTIEEMEGTAAHWAWLELLTGKQIDIGLIAPNGIPLTEEMCEGAELFADTVRSLMPEGCIRAEQMTACPSIDKDNWGTPDVWDVQSYLIDVIEYKFGHRYVEAFDNYQLVNQALSIIETLNLNGFDDQQWTIRMTVVQPRSFHHDGPVRTFTCKASDLRVYKNKIIAGISQAKKDNAYCFVNKHCVDCSGRAYCRTLQQAAYSQIDLAQTSSPLEMLPESLGLELRTVNHAIDVLKARASGLTEVALNTIRKGANVPGFKGEHGTGRLNWIKPIKEVVAMGGMMGINLAKESAITPTQAVKAGLSEDIVSAYAARMTGELKLVPDDGSLARRTFGRQDGSTEGLLQNGKN